MNSYSRDDSQPLNVVRLVAKQEPQRPPPYGLDF